MSTATLPPVNASALLTESEIRERQLKEVHDIILNQLNDSPVRKDIYKALETMGKRGVAMEADFAKVHACAEILDGFNLVLDGRGQVIRLAPEWKSMHEEYVAIMNNSQRVAIALNFKIQNLLDVILPYVELDASAEKKEIKINEYIPTLEIFVKIITDCADGSMRLRQNVVAFQKKLQDIIPSQIVNVKEQLEKLDADIQKFEGEIREVENVCRMLHNDAIKFKVGLEKMNTGAASKGNADDDEWEASVTHMHMRSLKAAYFNLQDSVNTYALSVAPA